MGTIELAVYAVVFWAAVGIELYLYNLRVQQSKVTAYVNNSVTSR